MVKGTTIGNRFTIEREIGSGGMGTVYRAHDRQRNVPVAVKVLGTYKPSDIERFLRESQLLSELAHPGIVRYVASGHIDGDALYYVMEWVDGTTLAEYVAETGLTIADSVALIRAISDALSHAHARGIVHRDLKPTNIILEDGNIAMPKLIDFGIARRMRDDLKLTHTGMAMGTPGYMAPEQVRGERELDARADVFALGCLLYECLAGVAAFAGATWLAVQSKILVADPAPIPGVPAALAAIVDKMLAKDPEQRIQTVAEVSSALASLPESTSTERRKPGGHIDSGTLHSQPAWRTPAPPQNELACFVIAVAESPPEDLGERIAAHGAEVMRLAEGAVVARVTPAQGKEPVAVRAARCAFALRDVAPSWPIAIVSDAGALDDATRELDASALASIFKGDAPQIRLDKATAQKLERAFEVRRDRIGLLLAPR